MSTAHLAQAQLLTTDALIELYTLDASALIDSNGNFGGVYNWTPGSLAMRQGGTIAASTASSQYLIVLDRVIFPSPSGGYTIQVLGADNLTVQNLPVTAFYQTSTSPTLTYVTVATIPAGLPQPGTAYTLIGPGTIAFAGVSYEPFPIAASGFEWTGQGKLPRPKLTVDNTLLLPGSTVPLAAALVITFGDLLGGTITRLRTFESFLDGQPFADSSAVFEPDIYRVDRKSAQTKSYIEFELAAGIDQIGLKLPARQVLRDVCNFTYRHYVAATATWVPGTCPYAGSAYFDNRDAITSDPSKDACSKLLSGCLKRYPPPDALPFAGFPGVGLASV